MYAKVYEYIYTQPSGHLTLEQHQNSVESGS